MTAQMDERTNEARVIPDGKPILMKLIGIKASKSMKSRQTDKLTKMVSWVLVVDDRKYPECAGFYVSYRTSSWSACGKNGGRSSNCYLFIAMVLGEDADRFERVDLYDVLAPYEEGQKQKLQRPDELRDLWGKYLVGWMEAPRPDDNGRVWQNAKEFKPPEFLDWEVEDRKMPVQTQEQQPLGLPKPVARPQAEPVQRPQNPPEPAKEPEPTPAQQAPADSPKSATEPTITEIDEWFKNPDHRKPHLEMIKGLLREKKADRIGTLSENDRTLLYYLMQVSSLLQDPNAIKREVARDLVNGVVDLRGVTSWESLDITDLKLLVTSIDNTDDDIPF